MRALQGDVSTLVLAACMVAFWLKSNKSGDRQRQLRASAAQPVVYPSFDWKTTSFVAGLSLPHLLKALVRNELRSLQHLRSDSLQFRS
jgi:hypothetical protein